jgi:hypothetical protein
MIVVAKRIEESREKKTSGRPDFPPLCDGLVEESWWECGMVMVTTEPYFASAKDGVVSLSAKGMRWSVLPLG